MAVPVRDLPLVLETGMQVVLVPPRLKGPRAFRIGSCSEAQSGQLLSLEGVRDLSTATELVGKTVLVRECDLPREFLRHDLGYIVGREVVDLRLGSLGAIEDLTRGPAQDLWVVNGPYGEVLIPVVDALVKDMGRPAGPVGEQPIVVDLPRGLVNEEVDA